MSYQGLIAELPIGQAGFNGSKNLTSVQPNELLQANNITYEDGTVRKEGGSAKYNASAISGTPTVLGGYDWWPTSTTQRMVIVCSDGKIYKDSGAGTFPVTLATGLTVSSSLPTFVEGGKEVAANNRKLFIFTGQNAVQVLSADGATTAAITTPPADWSGTNQPTNGFVHEFRLWGLGNANDPHRLYYSTTSSHEDFTGAGSGSLSIFPGEADGLVGAIPFGTGVICLKKPRGVYFVDTSSTTVANWRINRISGAVGGVGVRAFAQIDTDGVFMDTSGEFHLVSATTEFGDFLASTVPGIHDKFAPFVREFTSQANLFNATGVYYEAKRELHFAVPAVGSTVNNLRLVIDFALGGVPRARYSDKDTCTALWLKRDSDGIPRLTGGDNAGFVWNLDQDTRSKDGSGFGAVFQTPHDDFARLDPALGTKRKNGEFLELVVEPKGNFTLACDIYWDGDLHETVTFNMGTTGTALGSFILGTSALAGTQLLNKKKRITGGGRRFSVVGRNSAAGEDFSVAKMFVHFQPGDERLS